MDRSSIAIVIPALNEAATIGPVVSSSIDYGQVIVVDDGSTDETAQIARQAGAIVIMNLQNLGYDKALNEGFNLANQMGSEIIITLDADGQHDPSLITRFLEPFNNGVDMVLGLRNHKARLAEDIFSIFTRWRYGISDPLCGMKAYRLNVFRSLGYFDSYRSIGTELVLHAARQNFTFVEVPFTVRERVGTSRFGQRFLGNLRIFRAMFFAIFAM